MWSVWCDRSHRAYECSPGRRGCVRANVWHATVRTWRRWVRTVRPVGRASGCPGTSGRSRRATCRTLRTVALRLVGLANVRQATGAHTNGRAQHRWTWRAGCSNPQPYREASIRTRRADGRTAALARATAGTPRANSRHASRAHRKIDAPHSEGGSPGTPYIGPRVAPRCPLPPSGQVPRAAGRQATP